MFQLQRSSGLVAPVSSGDKDVHLEHGFANKFKSRGKVQCLYTAQCTPRDYISLLMFLFWTPPQIELLIISHFVELFFAEAARQAVGGAGGAGLLALQVLY